MKPDYGLDAPGVVRNLLLVTAAALVIWISAAAGWWSGIIRIGPVILPLSRMVIWPGIGCGLMACWMVYDSKIGKIRDREKLLDRIPWSGAERVLDVGCGRGLLLNAAARRLPDGRAVGLDL